MFIINAYNFIDGIDGLATVIGILIIFFFLFEFSVLLYKNDLHILCVVLLGSLISFLYFNLFNKKIRIFMGNSGSMLLGCLISFFSIYIFYNSKIKNTPIFIISNLFILLVDAISVCCIRIINKKSIFQSDTNHIHYKLLSLGFSHKNISLIFFLINFILKLLILLLKNLNINILLFILVSIGVFLYLLLIILYKNKN